jgi:hypothetical protein
MPGIRSYFQQFKSRMQTDSILLKRNEYQEFSSGNKARSERKADKLTTICEPIV